MLLTTLDLYVLTVIARLVHTKPEIREMADHAAESKSNNKDFSMSAKTNQIDIDYRKRDLAEKYSYAVSRLGTCAPEKRNYWREKLEQVSQQQAEFSQLLATR